MMWFRWVQTRRARSEFGSVGAVTLDWHDILREFSASDLIGVILAGIGAFLLTGFLGYSDQPKLFGHTLQPMAALYLWLCAILLLILLRHPALREQAIAPVVVLLASMVLVALVYVDRTYANGAVSMAVEQWLRHLGLSVNGGRLVSNLANFAVLGAYTIGMLVRWGRRYLPLGRSIAGAPHDSSGDGQADTRADSPLQDGLDLRKAIEGELLSGDLVAGAALAGMLALFFSPAVFTGLLKVLAPVVANKSTSGGQVKIEILPCTATLPIGNCPPTHGETLFYLSDIDVKVAVSFAIVGAVILASASAINAWRAVQNTPGLGFWPAAERLVLESARTLLSALGRLLTLRFFVLVRDVLWPAAIFVAALGAGLASQYVQCNLHRFGHPVEFSGGDVPTGCAISPGEHLNVLLAVGALFVLGTAVIVVSVASRRLKGTLAQAVRGLSGPLVFALALCESAVFAQTQSLGITPEDRYALLAVTWILLSMLALILGIGLWLMRWDVIAQSLIFLALFSFITLDVFWLFSFAFIGFNHFLLPAARQPFQINDAALFSLASFIATALIVVAYRLWRGPDRRRNSAEPVALQAGGAGRTTRGPAADTGTSN